MKKIFLLSSLALAALSANAQSVKIGNTTIKRGETGYIQYTFSDFDFTEADLLKAQIMPIEGLSLGEFDDVVFSKPLFDAADVDASSSGYQINKSGTIVYTVTVEGTAFNEIEGDLVISIPVKVAEDAELGTIDIIADETLGFRVGDLNNSGDFEVENGTLTITDGSAVTEYTATVYGAEGESSVKFSTKAQLEAALTGNTIVSFASAVPAEWAELDNVVVDGQAKSIVLTNADAYTYTGEAFHAASVEFTYGFSVKASKAEGGWNSLSIPFTGTPNVDPFTTADKENGKYWAKQFTGSTSEGLVFADLASAQFVANKAYILAFPGASYGANEFAGNEIIISAEDVEVLPSASATVPGDPFAMKTVYAGTTPAGAYVLNAATNSFDKKDAVEAAAPFTAYAIAASAAAPALRSLAILDANNGITSVEAVAANAGVVVYANEGDIVINANESGVATVYNVNGQVVKANVKYNEGETRIAGLAAGAYVVAGQVVILK